MTMKVTSAEFLGIDNLGEDELRVYATGLQTENAELREQLELTCDSKRVAERRVGRLSEQNAKMRELSETLWMMVWHKDRTREGQLAYLDLAARAFVLSSELGIEVPVD